MFGSVRNEGEISCFFFYRSDWVWVKMIKVIFGSVWVDGERNGFLFCQANNMRLEYMISKQNFSGGKRLSSMSEFAEILAHSNGFVMRNTPVLCILIFVAVWVLFRVLSDILF